MKTTKRLLCLVLSLAMIISCAAMVTVSAEGTTKKLTDVNDSEIYYDAVNTLSIMGIINGYEDGTFKPNQNVTRAEFTAMLMRTLKLGDTGSKSAAGLPFSDIDDNNSDINWAIPNINTAYGKGIINGYEDGTFRPSDNVAYEEAVKMIVCTLGYGADIDVSVSPWYANYISVASQIGITKTASKIGQVETPASRACIAQLLYDSLEVKLVENDKRTDNTILSSYLGYVRGTGSIYSNNVTSLASADVNLRDDEIQINGKDDDSNTYELHTYTTTDTSLKDRLGYEVEYYYKNDGSSDRTLMFCTLKGKEPVVINAKNIETSTSDNGQIKYYEKDNDDKTKSLSLASDNKVIYNGKYMGSSFNVSSDLPKVGQVKVIDSDNDGRYDVIDITSYDVYYVSTKDTSSTSIIDNLVMKAENKILTLDVDKDRNLSIVNKDGKTVTYSSISTGNIICVAKSKTGTITTKAVVLTDKVSGTISATDGDDKVTIGGKEYKFSDAAPWMNGGTTLSKPQMSDSGTYYLDINGDIVAYSKNSTTETFKYGYIEGYSDAGKSFESDIQLKIISTSGTEQLSTYKSTKVNGTTYSDGNEVVDQLRSSANNQNTDNRGIQQLIKYTTKTSGGTKVIDKIVTAEPSDKGKEIVSDQLNMLSTVSAKHNAEKLTYNSNSKTLEGNGVKINISSATVFSVPKTDDRSNYDLFKKTSVSTSFKNGNEYAVEVFDVSPTNAAKVVVVYLSDATKAEELDSSSPVYVLNELSQGKNDGDTMDQIVAFKATPTGSAQSTTEWVSDDSKNVNSFSKGDIFRAVHDNDGYTVLDSENKLYSIDGSNNDYKITFDAKDKDKDINKSEFVSILGSVAAIDNTDTNTILIAPEKLAKDGQYDASKAISFNISDFDNAKGIIYDTTGRNLEIKDTTGSAAVSGLVALSDGAEPSQVLIYMSEGKIKLICVLPK